MFEETVKRLAESTNKKYGGRLKNWSIHSVYDNVEFVMGEMVGTDPTGRFQAGYIVKTSSIVWLESDFDYVETSTTFYILEGQPNPNPLPDGLASRIFF